MMLQADCAQKLTLCNQGSSREHDSKEAPNPPPEKLKEHLPVDMREALN